MMMMKMTMIRSAKTEPDGVSKHSPASGHAARVYGSAADRQEYR